MSAHIIKRRALSGAFTAVLLSSTAVVAQETVIDAGTVVFTENRATTKKDRVGSKVEVVTRKDLEQHTQPNVTDYLATMPGVSLSTPGGHGQEGSLSVRGLPRRYVKTLFNGIDISDPTSTQVQTSYQYLLSGGISAIELLKGSQSTLYGSDAIAGVIAIDTLGSASDGIRHSLALEAGSNGHVTGGYGLTYGSQKTKFAFNATGLRTDGISAADKRNGNTERDGYDNITSDLNFRHDVSNMLSVFGSALFVKANYDYDDAGYYDALFNYIPVPVDNVLNGGSSRQLAGRMGFDLNLMDGRFRNTVSAQVFDLKRDIHSVDPVFGAYDGTFNGRRTKFDYQGAFDIADWLTWQFGADHEIQTADTADTYGTATGRHSLTGLWTEAIIQPNENLALTFGARHDIHSTFGGHTTWRATGSWKLPTTGTRLHASTGTGFKAPSLYQLFAPLYGNSSLQPETSFSADFGIEQTLLDGRVIADVTVFMLDVDNLIGFDFTLPPFGAYNQVPGTTRSRGVEASLTWHPTDLLQITGAYTYTSAHEASGVRAARIPVHEIALGAVWMPVEKWTVSGTAKIAIDTIDTDLMALDDYVLVNAKVAYKPNDNTEIYVRGENLLNQRYQTVRGYGTPGISVFAGFKATFGTD